ncbi:MAG: tyrosine-type recombinase/integrase [Deltaproteobacteria bacterium]
MKWQNSEYGSVRFREHKQRRHGIGKDKYFVIRHQFNGRRYDEPLGWASEGMSAKKAFLILAELKQNQATSTPPFTLKEKLSIEHARRDSKEREKIQIEAANITFKSFFENEYLPIQKTHKGRDTWIKEEQHGTNWIFPVVGNIPLKDISSFHIERIKKNLLDAGRSPRTIQYCFATIRQTWNHARRAGVVSGDSPTMNVKIPKFDNIRQRYLTPTECDNLLDELQKRSATTHQMAVISLDTGMRFSEIAGLQWQNIDIIRESISVMDTKSGKNRTVYMTGRVKSVFYDISKSGPDALVFPGRNGNKIKHISKTFDDVVANLGLNTGIDDNRLKCIFHSLRHTHASRLLESGADIYRVKELLGHANVTTTERYSHVTADRLRSAIKDMEKMNNLSKTIPNLKSA